MRCARCHRPLKFAAMVSANQTYGATCARIMGLHLTRSSRVAAPVLQAGQFALFDAEMREQ